MVRLALSVDEYELIEDLREIGFGETQEVKSTKSNPIGVKELEPEEAQFIKKLRTIGQFEKVILHDGLPKYAEIHGQTKQGVKYTQKVKF